MKGWRIKNCWPPRVSIPYWLGSKLRVLRESSELLVTKFQSPIGWGLSCEAGHRAAVVQKRILLFQSPIGWGLSCEAARSRVAAETESEKCFNPLLVGV
jgi:hypothetical protein